MFISSSSRKYLILFPSAVLLIGFLKIPFHGILFTECFSRLLYGALVLIWALRVQNSVLSARLRNLLLFVAFEILLGSFLGVMRFQPVFEQEAIQRYLLYVHYVPMMAISLALVYVSLYIHRTNDRAIPAAWRWLVCGGVLLTLGVLTNDFHFQAFSFPDHTALETDMRSRGWLMYAFMVYSLTAVLLSVCIILKKRQAFVRRNWCVIPILPIALEVLYAILYVLGWVPKYGEIYLWDYGEVFSVLTIAFLESCIQLGMIPANTDYERLFAATSYPAVILNRAGEPVYRTAGAHDPFVESDDVKIVRHDISGGSIVYAVDVRFSHALAEKIQETTRQLAARNAYLEEDNRVKREMAAVESRNSLYHSISHIIQPHLLAIDAIMKDEKRSLTQKLMKVALIKTYIKRRSNFELLGHDTSLSVGELTAALSESLQCMSLCGIQTSAAAFCEGVYPANMLIAAYEQFEAIAEECFDGLSAMNVSLCAEGGKMVLRMMLNAEDAPDEWRDCRKEYGGLLWNATVSKEDEDMCIALVFEKGSEQV